MKQLVRTANAVADFEWKHRNIIYFTISLLLAAYLVQTDIFHDAIAGLGSLNYVGSLFAGLGFSYAITSPFATISIYTLGKTLNPFYIAFIGAFGAMLSDYVIFRFFRDRLWKELNFVAKKELHIKFPRLSKVAKSRYLSHLIPAVAGLIIASPLPDEAAMLLLASVKYETKNVLMLSYWLNFLGILAVASVATII
jgi:hypothetical protein